MHSNHRYVADVRAVDLSPCQSYSSLPSKQLRLTHMEVAVLFMVKVECDLLLRSKLVHAGQRSDVPLQAISA